MKVKPDAILFDMDGVLVDSLDSWWFALNSALKAFNHKEISKKEFIEKLWGHDLNDNLRHLKLDHKVGTFCNNIYRQNVAKVRIYPDTKRTLKKLKNYRKGIITNTPKDCTYQILKQFDIEKYFESVVTSDEVGIGKPHPEIVIKACHRLNVDPRTVVLVGDTLNDVKAGKAVGCTVVGINIPADITIQKLSQLTDIVLLYRS